MKRCSILLFFIVSFFLIWAGEPQKVSPKIVVCINIEHFRADYINRYWDSFQYGGFKRLYNGGANFASARANLHNIKSSTLVSTIFSGTYPSEHGIVGDKWYRQLTGTEIDAVADNYYLTLGSDSDLGSVSAKQLKVFTIGDVLKQQTNHQSKVFSVAINAHAAVLSAGHAADGAYWFDQTNGNFVTSSYYIDRFPDWAIEFNQKNLAQMYLQREWDLLLPESSYSASFNDDYVLEDGFWNRWNTFPYNLSKIAKDQEYPLSIIKASPFGNKMVRDFAVHIIEHEKLGTDAYPDLLNITFSTLDYANKWFNPYSVEIQESYLRLDIEIASLLNYLDKNFGKENYLVCLTSASTSSFPVDVLKNEQGFDSGEFSPQSAMALLRSYLNAIFGVGNWVKMYNEEQIYLDHDLINKKEIDLNDMRNKVALFLNQFSGVKAALPAHVIESGNLNNSRFVTIENSYCVQRSGDVVILLEEGWMPVYKYNQIDYSSELRIPLCFYGMYVKEGIYYPLVEVIDIVPTICKFMEIVPPNKANGKVLEQIFW